MTFSSMSAGRIWAAEEGMKNGAPAMQPSDDQAAIELSESTKLTSGNDASALFKCSKPRLSSQARRPSRHVATVKREGCDGGGGRRSKSRTSARSGAEYPKGRSTSALPPASAKECQAP